MVRRLLLAALLTTAVAVASACSADEGDLAGDEAPTATGAPVGADAPTATPAATPTPRPTATPAPTPTPRPAEQLSALVDDDWQRAQFAAVLVTSTGDTATIEGAVDDGRLAVRFDFAAVLALAAALDPAVADDPFLGQAERFFGGTWEVRTIDGSTFVRAPGLAVFAGGGDDDWVAIDEAFVAGLGLGDIVAVARPADLAAALAAADDLVVDDTAASGTIDLGAPTTAELSIADGRPVGAALTLPDGGTVEVTYDAVGEDPGVAPPDPDQVVEAPF